MFYDPVFVSLFLLVFGFFWILFCGVLSWQTGWYRYAREHPYPEKTVLVRQFKYSSVQFNSVGSYTYGMLLSIHKEGIGLRPLLLFKAFHPPFFIYWNEIGDVKEVVEFFRYPALDVYAGEKKIRFYGKPIEKIKQEYLGHKENA